MEREVIIQKFEKYLDTLIAREQTEVFCEAPLDRAQNIILCEEVLRLLNSQKKAKWVNEHCSNCGRYLHASGKNYCINCGAIMEDEE